MNLHVQAIATVLSLMNPAICGIIFQRLEPGRTSRQRVVDATRAALAILAILELAALGGAATLNLFGISLDIFSMAGGGVLVWMGFTMLRGASNSSGGESKPAGDTPSLTPLILFAASPGTITGVITLAVSHSGSGLPGSAMIAVAVATLVTWGVLVLVAHRDTNGGGGSLIRSIIQCFMGLIVMAMGVQFSATGVVSFLQGAGL